MYKPQSEFPYLQEFRNKFDITDETIFAYGEEIFTNFNLPDDLLAHELKHCERQNKIGKDKWIKNYLERDSFRLNEELIAFSAQLNSIKDRNERNEVRIKAARSLSGKLYGEIITYAEALNKLRLQ